jgi:hypothetical protein
MVFWRLDINGELWRSTKKSPYKHGIATYGIGIVTYDGWQKIQCHNTMATNKQH